MNNVDVALILLLAVCFLRGYWRGFFREGFGLLALVAAALAAVSLADRGVELLQQRVRLPEPTQAAIAFVAIFIIVHSSVNLIGVLLDRVASSALLRGVNGLAGAALGAVKGAAVLAFVLLFLHLFPLSPTLNGRIMASTIGRPLLMAAGDSMRLSSRAAVPPDAPSES